MRNLPQVILLSIAFAIAGCFGGGDSRQSREIQESHESLDLPPLEARKKKKDPSGPSSPGSATLSWYPPTENDDGSYLDNLAGYRIYYGKSANKLDQAITIDNPGLTRYVVENLPAAKWHFVMTSVNAKGVESKRSPAVSKKVG